MKNIKALVLPKKEVEFPFSLYPEFKVKLTYLSKPEELRLREDALVTKYDDKLDVPYTEIDTELHQKLFAERCITGWSGLTMGILSQLVLLDDSGDDFDPDELVDYSPENAETLLSNSKIFDAWVLQTMIKVDNFRHKSKAKPV